MSNYVQGTSLSYQDYLQAKSFVSDITSASRGASLSVAMQVSHQTREIIASNEALARENVYAMRDTAEMISGELTHGFEQLSYGLSEIALGISELSAKFHWGFSKLITALGRMSDALSELIRIAKTPVQTVAYNHFEIARDAFRQGLYSEALKALHKAIDGDHTSPGYPLEWRFHQMVGTIHLGFADCDLALVDLPKAEAAFLLAARYAKTDFTREAAHAFLSAGWTAYCQGKKKDALTYLQQALALHAQLGEALFLKAKVYMAFDEVETALPVLRSAIDLERFYALKAAGDGDFQKHEQRLHGFLEALRVEKYHTLTEQAQASLKVAEPWLSRNVSEDQALPCVVFLQDFLKNHTIALIDVIDIRNELQKKIAELDSLNQQWLAIEKKWPQVLNRTKSFLNMFSLWINKSDLGQRNSDIAKIRTFIDIGTNWPLLTLFDFFSTIEAKLDTLESVAKPKLVVIYSAASSEHACVVGRRGFFREPIRGTLRTIRDDIYGSHGELLTSVEFCQIPAGEFVGIGANEKIHRYTFSKSFYLSKYLITQDQWEKVMGKHDSHFKLAPNLPVEVGKSDCERLLEKLNEAIGKTLYRLPSVVEWEYAYHCGASKIRQFQYQASLQDGVVHFAYWVDRGGYSERTPLWGIEERLAADNRGAYKNERSPLPVNDGDANGWGVYFKAKILERCMPLEYPTRVTVRGVTDETRSYFQFSHSISSEYSDYKFSIGFRLVREDY